MRTPLLTTLLAFSFALPLAALAATPRTAVLDVQNMTCSVCPITVKKSLQQVPGVAATEVDFQKKTATVKYDADKVTLATLVKATGDAGYPSTARK